MDGGAWWATVHGSQRDMSERLHFDLYNILKKKKVHTSSKDCIIHSHFESAVPSPEQIKMICKVQKRKH